MAAAHKQITNASIIVRAAFRKRIRDVYANFDFALEFINTRAFAPGKRVSVKT